MTEFMDCRVSMELLTIISPDRESSVDMTTKLVRFLLQMVVAVPLKPVVVPISQSPEVDLVPLPMTDQPHAPLEFLSEVPFCVSWVEA